MPPNKFSSLIVWLVFELLTFRFCVALLITLGSLESAIVPYDSALISYMIGPSLQAHTGKSLIRWRSLANNLEFYDDVNEVIEVRGYRSNTRGELAEKKRSNV